MAAFKKEESLANLFELQDKERLLETNLYVSGGIKYKGRESGALSVLNKLRLEGEVGFCDVILEVEGRQLTTHRCVLAANSQFFYTMFSSGMKEANQKVVSLHSICFTSMSLILDYFYTREIVINCKNVLDLLNASSFLLVTPVKKACIELLSRKLCSVNCFSVLQVAEQFGAGELAEKAKYCIKTNFSIVVNSEEFVSISQKQLLHFISSDDTLVEKEEEVYQSVLQWVKHDEANRVGVLPELLKHLRKDSLPKGFLESEMEREPLLMVAKRDGTKRLKKVKIEKFVQAVRQSTKIHDVLIGCKRKTSGTSQIFLYDLDKQERVLLPSKLEYLKQIEVVGRTLFVTGGPSFHYPRLSALCFDNIINPRSLAQRRRPLEFESKAPFRESRLASLVNLNGLLYYIGGVHSGSDSPCNTVECYNPEMDEWNFCTGLGTPRCWSGCVASEENIYIIGGETRRHSGSLLSSVEKYDPESDSWSYIAPLKEGRARAQCVYWGDKIYAIGGMSFSPRAEYRNCEVYCPMTDEWQTIAQLPYRFSIPERNVIILRNQITVLMDPLDDFSFEALQYDVQSNAWVEVKTLGCPRSKNGSFKFHTIKLPVCILERIAREFCG